MLPKCNIILLLLNQPVSREIPPSEPGPSLRFLLKGSFSLAVATLRVWGSGDNPYCNKLCIIKIE